MAATGCVAAVSPSTHPSVLGGLRPPPTSGGWRESSPRPFQGLVERRGRAHGIASQSLAGGHFVAGWPPANPPGSWLCQRPFGQRLLRNLATLRVTSPEGLLPSPRLVKWPKATCPTSKAERPSAYRLGLGPGQRPVPNAPRLKASGLRARPNGLGGLWPPPTLRVGRPPSVNCGRPKGPSKETFLTGSQRASPFVSP